MQKEEKELRPFFQISLESKPQQLGYGHGHPSINHLHLFKFLFRSPQLSCSEHLRAEVGDPPRREDSFQQFCVVFFGGSDNEFIDLGGGKSVLESISFCCNLWRRSANSPSPLLQQLGITLSCAAAAGSGFPALTTSRCSVIIGAKTGH